MMVLDLCLLSLCRRFETTESNSDNPIIANAAMTDGVRNSGRHQVVATLVSSSNGNKTSNPQFPATQLRGKPTLPENDLVIDQTDGALSVPVRMAGAKFGQVLYTIELRCGLHIGFASLDLRMVGGRRHIRTPCQGIGRREARVHGMCVEATGVPASGCGCVSAELQLGPGCDSTAAGSRTFEGVHLVLAGGWRGAMPRHYGCGVVATGSRSAAGRNRFGDRTWMAPGFRCKRRGRRRQGKHADGSAKIRETKLLTIDIADCVHPETGVAETYSGTAGGFNLDQWHAGGYMSAALRRCVRKRRNERNSKRRSRREPKAGSVDAAVAAFTPHRHRHEAAARCGYHFASNKARAQFRYDRYRQQGTQIVSGVVESAVRQIVDLRK